MVFSGPENTDSRSPLTFPLGSSTFCWMRCKWKSLLLIPAYKAASGGLTLHRGGNLVEVAGDEETNWTGCCLRFPGSLLLADGQVGQEPPPRRTSSPDKGEASFLN